MPLCMVSSIIDATATDIQEMKMTNPISLHSNLPRWQHTFYMPPIVAQVSHQGCLEALHLIQQSYCS
jgi:hypothetical protein